MPTKLEDYADKYQCVRFERRGGILQMTLHTEGGSLRWGFLPHGELRRQMQDLLGYGLGMELLALGEKPEA